MAQNFVFQIHHFALLGSLPFELVHELWEGLPLEVDGHRLSTLQVVERISSRGTTPTPYLFKLCGRIESFYCEHGLRLRDFMESLLRLGTREAGFHTDVFPVIDRAYQALLRGEVSNVIEGMFDLIDQNNRKLFGNLKHRTIYKQKLSDKCRYVAISDIRGPGGLPVVFDFAMYILQPVLGAPTYFGRPPLAYAPLLTAQPGVDDILWPPAEAVVRGGELHIDGECYGRLIPFSSFLATCGVDLLLDKLPLKGDPSVVVLDREYVCPTRGRTVLQRNTAYGAPYWLFLFDVPLDVVSEQEAEVGHRRLLDYALGHRPYGIEHYRSLDRAFMQYLRERQAEPVVYHTGHEMITIRGQQIVRSVPARILAKILREYSATGKTRFAYWEFLDDRGLLPDKQNHHLPRRIERLIVSVRKKTDRFELHRPCRGTIELIPKRPFAFSSTS